ncbi:hypothetical protein BKA83DRAFT_1055619 [Pisolithus microcarpus]|nr:hypothetical protein BKA83DRAFT_1055619 [Pisolithus microcarpus]
MARLSVFGLLSIPSAILSLFRSILVRLCQQYHYQYVALSLRRTYGPFQPSLHRITISTTVYIGNNSRVLYLRLYCAMLESLAFAHSHSGPSAGRRKGGRSDLPVPTC